MALCRRCDSDMSYKQKIRKLIQELRLSLYQEAIKHDYSTTKKFLEKIQRLENLEKLVELRQNSVDESTINWSFDSSNYSPPIEQDLSIGRQHTRSSFHHDTSALLNYVCPFHRFSMSSSTPFDPFKYTIGWRYHTPFYQSTITELSLPSPTRRSAHSRFRLPTTNVIVLFTRLLQTSRYCCLQRPHAHRPHFHRKIMSTPWSNGNW